MRLNRRNFATTVGTLAVLPVFGRAEPPIRAAVIGATRRGDYGHGMERVFQHRQDVTLVAVADADATGLAKALKSSGAPKGYADYRQMLEREKPQVVVIASRHTDQHHAMAIAALGMGAHLLLEKPFVTTPAEGDAILALAERDGCRVAVAHQTRLDGSVTELVKRQSELLGELLEVRAWGKQDAARAGGEDMMVLGTHLFDLMRLFAGDVRWCQATVTQKGKPITRASGRITPDWVGPVAGDRVTAQFGFSGGSMGTFTSGHPWKAVLDPWGMELLGSQGMARVVMDGTQRVYVRFGSQWGKDGKTVAWAPLVAPAAKMTGRKPVVPNGYVADDLLEAAANRCDPACSGKNGLAVVEMVMGVYQAALKSARVNFPLADRGSPFSL